VLKTSFKTKSGEINQGLWIRIRIGNPDPGARKLRNFSGKMSCLVICLKKILPLKRYKIALTTVLFLNLMNKTGIFYLILLKF
jgi:hypothetical protein